MTITSGERPAHGARGPVRRAERALAPDLARGSMLLFIALANCAGVVFGGGPGVDTTPEGAERGFNLLMFTFVNSRAYPMFAVMFGYGLVQLARRQESAGATPADVRSVLVRRNAWLVGFGLLHGILLYFGDFLGAYGLVGIVVVLVLLRRGDRVHRLALWLWALFIGYVLVLAVLALIAFAHGSGVAATVPIDPVASLVAGDYGTAVRERLTEWPLHTASVVGFILIVWLGVWAARRRVLEDPASHRRLLRFSAIVGLGIAFLGGLPLALVSAGMLHADASTVSMFSLLHAVSGMFGGPGYVALFGLLVLRLTKSGPAQGMAVRALSALGQRSLSGYLFQSVAWTLLLAPYTLALGGKLGSPTFAAAFIAVLVWLASVVGAAVLHRYSRRGPAEVVLRRLTYGRRE